ncbi:MAG: hypothetical protein PWP63_1267 [Methanolobus sp.]|jgi:hypothetical protein|nr:hypothetical protein [Methanolobus sp.]
MGGGTMLITLISPGSPVSNFSGESRTFKASVNMDDPIVRWKLDGVLVQEHIPQEYMDLPANTELSYTTTASFGIHELEIEAEKDGVLVSNSWIWNVGEIVSSCSNSYMSGSGNLYIKIKNAILFRRPNGTYYVNVDWSVHGCETFRQESYPYKRCKMTVTTRVSWDYIAIPGQPSPYPPEQVQEIDSCSGSGSNTLEVESRNCVITIHLFVKCFAYYTVLFLMEEESCSCYLGNP